MKTTPEIKGESEVEGYKTWIDVHSDNEGLISRVSRDGGGLSGGKTELQNVTLSISSGAHVGEMLKQGMSGKHFDKIELVFLFRTGEDAPQKFRTLTLEHAMFESWGYGGGGGNDKGYDSASIVCEKATWEYFKQDKQGLTASSGTATIDTKSGKVS